MWVEGEEEVGELVLVGGCLLGEVKGKGTEDGGERGHGILYHTCAQCHVFLAFFACHETVKMTLQFCVMTNG